MNLVSGFEWENLVAFPQYIGVNTSLWNLQRITQEADKEFNKIWFNHIKRAYKSRNSKKERKISINLTHSLAKKMALDVRQN